MGTNVGMEQLNSYFAACEDYNNFANNVVSISFERCGSMSGEATEESVKKVVEGLLEEKYHPVRVVASPRDQWLFQSIEYNQHHELPFVKAVKTYCFSFETPPEDQQSMASMNYRCRVETVAQGIMNRLNNVLGNPEGAGFANVTSFWRVTEVNQMKGCYDIIFDDFVFVLANDVYLLHFGLSD